MIDDLVIYTGTQCNFNCNYCDRDYIKEAHGYQKLYSKDLPDIYKLLDSLSYNFKMLSFHGGEPFLFTKLMDKIIENGRDFPLYYIQTNGSLILKNKEFLEKWADKLLISISYDFIYQDINRTYFDMEETLKYLKSINIPVKLQSVVPMSGEFFKAETLYKILSWHEKDLVQKYGFVPLKYIRSIEAYNILLDNMTKNYISEFFSNYIRFLQTLVINNIPFHLDGVDDFYNTSYKEYEDPVELIVSPDGYLYSEFDFLDYRQTDVRYGKWRNELELYPEVKYKLLSYCETCQVKDMCGLKYARGAFNLPVDNDHCEFFLNLQKMTFMHIKKLQSAPLLEQISI